MPQSFASSASLLIALQVGSRLFTFGLNQALLRFVSPRAFGTAAIQFELLSSTILFLSREGFRNALIRAWSDGRTKGDEQGDLPSSIVNLTLLPTIIGVPVSALATIIYRASCSKETSNQSFFEVAVAMYALASCLELASEPLHIRYVPSSHNGFHDHTELEHPAGLWVSYEPAFECEQRVRGSYSKLRSLSSSFYFPTTDRTERHTLWSLLRRASSRMR
jgi:hypothetical protein